MYDREWILSETEKRFREKLEHSKELNKLDAYDLETYCNFVVRENPQVFTHSPPAEYYTRPVEFDPAVQKELDERNSILKEIRENEIKDCDYDFDPEEYSVDRKIPKGGILQALRDSCK
jgi:hypothetical protein